MFVPLILPCNMQVFNELFKEAMTEADVLSMVAKSQEFEAIKVLYNT